MFAVRIQELLPNEFNSLIVSDALSCPEVLLPELAVHLSGRRAMLASARSYKNLSFERLLMSNRDRKSFGLRERCLKVLDKNKLLPQNYGKHLSFTVFPL